MCNGEVCLKQNSFVENHDALFIHLYRGELELHNHFGSKRDKHKITVRSHNLEHSHEVSAELYNMYASTVDTVCNFDLNTILFIWPCWLSINMSKNLVLTVLLLCTQYYMTWIVCSGTALLYNCQWQQTTRQRTRKPSCRWQTRATLAKSLHGLCKSSGVGSCIARLPIDSLPMVSYYVLYSNYLWNASLWRHSPFKTTMTLKLGSGVTQGHRKWHQSIACIWFPITVL